MAGDSNENKIPDKLARHCAKKQNYQHTQLGWAWNLMEYSKLNLQSSDLSLFQPTDSQILASSCSLSIPSEPPDLKNWFPSYQYESPVLNSNSLFDEFVTHKSEIDEKDEVFVHKKQNPNGVVKCGSSSGNEHENQCFSKIPGSLESPSFLSEPADIRNWFSSYVYESSYLDTTDGFGDSCKEGKREKDEFLVENSDREREEDLGDCSESRSGSEEVVGEKVLSEGLSNCNSSWRDDKKERQPVSETPGPLESPLLLSEPTDIRNWFSSYVYESPSLGTTDGFGDSVCKENICEMDGILVENSYREIKEDLEDFSKNRSDNEEEVGDKVQSEGLLKCNSSWRDNKQQRQPVSEGDPNNAGVNDLLPGQNDLYFEHIPKTLQNHGTSPAKDVQKSSLDKEGSQCKPEEKFFHGTRFMLPNNQRSACSNDGKSPPNLIYGRDFILQESSEAKVHAEVDCSPHESDSELIPVNGASVRKPTHGSKDRKDDGKEISVNGFITTKKGKLTRKSNQNSLEGQQENSKGAIPLAGGKDAVVKRKALADTTNFHHSPVMEITGKWNCPQKSKPNQGPPLKQLRLGKWFRKL